MPNKTRYLVILMGLAFSISSQSQNLNFKDYNLITTDKLVTQKITKRIDLRKSRFKKFGDNKKIPLPAYAFNWKCVLDHELI